MQNEFDLLIRLAIKILRSRPDISTRVVEKLEEEIEAKNSVAICKHEGCFLPATCKEYCGGHCECLA